MLRLIILRVSNYKNLIRFVLVTLKVSAINRGYEIYEIYEIRYTRARIDIYIDGIWK
jgi:hypothetical protein